MSPSLELLWANPRAISAPIQPWCMETHTRDDTPLLWAVQGHELQELGVFLLRFFFFFFWRFFFSGATSLDCALTLFLFLFLSSLASSAATSAEPPPPRAAYLRRPRLAHVQIFHEVRHGQKSAPEIRAEKKQKKRKKRFRSRVSL